MSFLPYSFPPLTESFGPPPSTCLSPTPALASPSLGLRLSHLSAPVLLAEHQRLS